MEERDLMGMSDLSLETAASQNLSRSGGATNMSSGSLQNNSYMQPKKQKSGKDASLIQEFDALNLSREQRSHTAVPQQTREKLQ